MSTKSKLLPLFVFGLLVGLISPLAHAGGEIRDMLAQTVSVITRIALSDEIASKHVDYGGVHGGQKNDCNESDARQEICVLVHVGVAIGAPEQVLKRLEDALRNPCALLNQPNAEEILKATTKHANRGEFIDARKRAQCVEGGGGWKQHLDRLVVKVTLYGQDGVKTNAKSIALGGGYGK